MARKGEQHGAFKGARRKRLVAALADARIGDGPNVPTTQLLEQIDRIRATVAEEDPMVASIVYERSRAVSGVAWPQPQGAEIIEACKDRTISTMGQLKDALADSGQRASLALDLGRSSMAMADAYAAKVEDEDGGVADIEIPEEDSIPGWDVPGDDIPQLPAPRNPDSAKGKARLKQNELLRRVAAGEGRIEVAKDIGVAHKASVWRATNAKFRELLDEAEGIGASGSDKPQQKVPAPDKTPAKTDTPAQDVVENAPAATIRTTAVVDKRDEQSKVWVELDDGTKVELQAPSLDQVTDEEIHAFVKSHDEGRLGPRVDDAPEPSTDLDALAQQIGGLDQAVGQFMREVEGRLDSMVDAFQASHKLIARQLDEHEDLHPFVRGLIEALPEPGTAWSHDDRDQWINTATGCFDLMYAGTDDNGEEE